MNNTVVLDGEMELIQRLDGDMELVHRLDGDMDVAIGFGGLAYETGQFTVTGMEKYPNVEIGFANEHQSAPIMVSIVDATNSVTLVGNSFVSEVIWDFKKTCGAEIPMDTDPYTFLNVAIGAVYYSVQDTYTQGMPTRPIKGDLRAILSENLKARYITNTGFKPGHSNYYFLPGRTYKWYAVWK